MQFRKMSWAVVSAAIVLSGLPAGMAHASAGGPARAAGVPARSAATREGGASQAARRPAGSTVTGWDHGQPVRVRPDGRLATGAAAAQPATTGPAAPAADPNGGSLAWKVDDAIESSQGTPLMTTLPGSHGGYLRLHGADTIAAMSASGQVLWQRSSAQLYAAWHLQWEHPGSTTPVPQLLGGNPPANPFVDAGVQGNITANDHSYAVGHLAGVGVPVVAVAQVVGVSLSASRCFNCAQPFTVPGSGLHMGTFVTVLSATTGAVLYSELDPGFVTQVVITGGMLLLGDETGSPAFRQPMGEWYSTSSVRALTFRQAGGRLRAEQRWKYDTHAPWGRLLALVPAGSGELMLAWSDTPPGLGVPGPPDGHLVALSQASGKVRWDRRTAGYPVLASYDPARRLLAVVSQQDPAAGFSYTLTGIRPADGSTALAVRRAGDLATALTLTAGEPGQPDRWLVAAVDTSPAPPDEGGLAFTAGRVTAVDPVRQRQVWSAELRAAGMGPLMTGAVVSTGGAVVASSWDTDLPQIGARYPHLTDSEVAGMSLRSGRRLWQRSGDSADPLSLSVAGAAVRLATLDQLVQLIDPATGRVRASQPLLGSVTTAVVADATGHGTSDLILGDQSGGVFALSGQNLAGGQPRLLWQAQAGGPVVHMVVADLDGRDQPDLVVAATSRVTVIDLRTGRIRYQVAFPGQFIWSVAAGRLGTGSSARMGIVVPGSSLTALDGPTGRRLWTWQPKTAAYFSDAQITHGMVVSDYASHVTGSAPAAVMAEVGISGASGRVAWTAPQHAPATQHPQLWNGVAASPDIPGAGGLGAAFSWVTDDGDGRVDVRNAVTGALDYSNTAPELGAHEGFLTDPQLGLIDYGQGGTTVIGPSGPVADDDIDASDAALTTAPTGERILAVAYNNLQAYPASTLTTPGASGPALAANTMFLPGQVLAARLSGLGNVVIDMPQNQTAMIAVSVEENDPVPPLILDSQLGVAVVSMTGTPAATTAPGRAPHARPAAARPRTVSLAAAPPGSGLTQPEAQLVVHGYDRAGRPELTSTQPTGFSPAAITTYLGAGSTGGGQTVAIVDAYADPTIRRDVNAFSAQYGLPRACPGDQAGPSCFRLTVHKPPAGTPADSGWALETALDVEWAHAIAPRARIVLAESASGTLADQFRAVATAAAYHPDDISLSWDVPEEFSDETYYDHYCKLAASICVVSSGDAGYPSGYPATSSRALTIGGTTLQLNTDNSVASEIAWAGSGGGRSYFEPAPPTQSPVTGDRFRDTPDVSYDADPATGVAVFDSTPYDGQTGWFLVGGTSVGAPSWAAILAGADQLLRQAGQPVLTTAGYRAQQAIYSLPPAALADITAGPVNGPCPGGLCQPGTGFDDVTGLGSPRTGIEAALASAAIHNTRTP